MKFKPGQRVKVINEDDFEFGNVGRVDHIREDEQLISVEFPDEIFSLFESHELAKVR